MKEINVTVIGSGSTYCPELVDGFLQRQDSLKLKRLVLLLCDRQPSNLHLIRILCDRGFAIYIQVRGAPGSSDYRDSRQYLDQFLLPHPNRTTSVFSGISDRSGYSNGRKYRLCHCNLQPLSGAESNHAP